MLHHEQLLATEYHEAWANTRHCDIIFRTTLFAMLAYSISLITIYYNSDSNIPNLLTQIGSWIGVLLSYFTAAALLKIQRAYELSFERIKELEKFINNHIVENIESGKYKMKLGRPLSGGSMSLLSGKSSGILIVIINMFILFSLALYQS